MSHIGRKYVLSKIPHSGLSAVGKLTIKLSALFNCGHLHTTDVNLSEKVCQLKFGLAAIRKSSVYIRTDFR